MYCLNLISKGLMDLKEPLYQKNFGVGKSLLLVKKKIILNGDTKQ